MQKIALLRRNCSRQRRVGELKDLLGSPWHLAIVISALKLFENFCDNFEVFQSARIISLD